MIIILLYIITLISFGISAAVEVLPLVLFQPFPNLSKNLEKCFGWTYTLNNIKLYMMCSFSFIMDQCLVIQWMHLMINTIVWSSEDEIENVQIIKDNNRGQGECTSKYRRFSCMLNPHIGHAEFNRSPNYTIYPWKTLLLSLHMILSTGLPSAKRIYKPALSLCILVMQIFRSHNRKQY